MIILTQQPAQGRALAGIVPPGESVTRGAPSSVSGSRLAAERASFKMLASLYLCVSGNLGKCILSSCQSNMKCTCATFKHALISFFSEILFGPWRKQIYNGNFRKHSGPALDKMKVYQMGNKRKKLGEGLNLLQMARRRNCTTCLLPPAVWVAIKSDMCHGNRDINNLLKL